MNFKDKYTTDPKEDKKVLVSNEAYLFAEMLEELTQNIAALRLKLNG